MLRPIDVQKIAQISQGKLRLWKEKLTPLNTHKGNKPDYNLGDVLALRVVSHLDRDLGVPIHRITPISEQLFKRCSDAMQQGGDRYLLVALADGGVELKERSEIAAHVTTESPQILVRLAPHIQAIQGALQGTRQHELRLHDEDLR
jgi:DNA-binding transcriptional MerR regulator